MVRDRLWLQCLRLLLQLETPGTRFLSDWPNRSVQGLAWVSPRAFSDDGSPTGRGHPWARGLVCGAMTAFGGIGHTPPFLIARFHAAMTIAFLVVLVELAIITWIRHRSMETPIMSAATQLALGGALVFGTGVLIGSS
jgi:erythrin-vacuolar iron transport family protein